MIVTSIELVLKVSPSVWTMYSHLTSVGLPGYAMVDKMPSVPIDVFDYLRSSQSICFSHPLSPTSQDLDLNHSFRNNCNAL
jgi:hypothetical protein